MDKLKQRTFQRFTRCNNEDNLPFALEILNEDITGWIEDTGVSEVGVRRLVGETTGFNPKTGTWDHFGLSLSLTIFYLDNPAALPVIEEYEKILKLPCGNPSMIHTAYFDLCQIGNKQRTTIFNRPRITMRTICNSQALHMLLKVEKS